MRASVFSQPPPLLVFNLYIAKCSPNLKFLISVNSYISKLLEYKELAAYLQGFGFWSTLYTPVKAHFGSTNEEQELVLRTHVICIMSSLLWSNHPDIQSSISTGCILIIKPGMIPYDFT